MKIAVEGCMHGDLDKVYKTLQHMEKTQNTKIDLLLCCGDFQAVRNENDLKSLNVLPKYREMKSFWKYYSGLEVAPYPTIFIGGNHEASNYLWELYYGGWVAPNIYYLGAAGVVRFGNIRIGGLSGIFNGRHYNLGHFERPPYDQSTIRSVYHVREYDVQKLNQVQEPIDIFLSHDWPVRITDYGDWEELVRKKSYFKQEIEEKRLGSKPAALLLERLKPHYWFSAHLHCKFSALVQHGEGGPLTKFLALDKCIPGRDFLQIVEIESEPGPYEIQYDEEWLAITRRFNSIFPLTTKGADFRAVNLEMEDCREWVRSRLRERGCKPFEFVKTAPCYDDPSQSSSDGAFTASPRNPQTESLLQLLELPYLLDRNPEEKNLSPYPSPSIQRGPVAYDNKDIPIDDVDDDDEDHCVVLSHKRITALVSMETRSLILSLLVSSLLILSFAVSFAASSLSFNFYAASCPTAEFIIRNAVSSSSSTDPSIPGKLLRLVFHDCFVEGCDASLMLQGNNTEQSDPGNRTVGGFSAIELAKRVLEMFCPGVVSCADIIALAARDAVEIAGGPRIQIPTGRRDGMVSVASNVRPNIVDTSFTMDEMMKLFSNKGLSLLDLVVLSGAHTIGTAHCNTFRDRFQEDSKGKLRPIDQTLDSSYANQLMKQCPVGAQPSATVNNDPETSMAFDNQYYRNLLAHKGLFQSDSVLLNNNSTRKIVEDFANDQDLFFENWGLSFLKLTSVGVKTDNEGEIRRSCGTTNA
ncbi:lariat debranching enzyme [Lotus japonicus]|uniref:lariat debranching enzyme n=1 Tax=Lotus japonicus TaxID=34305 RepID=UPI00258393F3|nr:lariat debranching enzyme [Lotus japonicus]